MAVLIATNKESERVRELPAHVVMYCVIALALYVQSSYREVLRCLLEGIQWLREPPAEINVPGIRPFRRHEPGWAGSRCGNYTMNWCSRSPWRRRRVHGFGDGVWSALMAVPWMSPTRRAMKKRSVVPGPAAVRAHIRRSASCRWWRTVPMFFLAAGWQTMPPARSLLQRTYYPVSAKTCCVWRTAVFSGSGCGRRLRRQVPVCCGGSKRTCVCPATQMCRTVLI